ncbi:hypothetical protein M011DRAFT_457013 [Sporormia fimetaria CBS 119925]|uniref:Protein SMG7 n=1 Tax=Sporormia fimetaria CBS 119925 TaxID=1340428 RepID=A0A6A6VJ56_9PLEO|nr:hypothetical protein M011DRAFT_457013 [Sporormia fimetaria CBS 119925]
MAGTIQQSYERAQLIGAQLSELADAGLSDELTALLKEYRTACESVLLGDFEYASTVNLDQQLWDAHLKVNNTYRKALRNLKRNSRDHVVELRKVQRSYLSFIKASQRFYRQHIVHLDAQVDGLDELRKIARKLVLEQQPTEHATSTIPSKPLPRELYKKVLLSCHQALIQLGDLSRYRETELAERNRNWGPAVGYYGLAVEVYPDSGQPHNQLAVIAREDGDHFRSTYHLYRSLACMQPHPLARRNLAIEFKKVVTAWDKGELIKNQTSPDGNGAGRALIAWFIRLHSKCFKGEEFPEHHALETEVLSQMAIELKERSLDSTLRKMILINLAAEYVASKQNSATPAEEIQRARAHQYYTQLNTKTFSKLLYILQSELEGLSEREDVTQNGDSTPQLSDKITAVTRRVLPGLRLYSIWFSKSWNRLSDNCSESTELWKAYAAALSAVASNFPVDQLPNGADDFYMLEEDTETIGCQPLVSQQTMRYWYDNNALKKRYTDLERNHPNVEMLMRVRDFLIGGLELTQLPDAPLDLDAPWFVYRESAPPSDKADVPLVSHTGPAKPSDLPLLSPAPTQLPGPQQQMSYNVVAPSDTASTGIAARDNDIRQMVDDLVGADDSLETLLEDDGNNPPTPPEQTFEDTVVTTNGHGDHVYSIADLVNTVKNYKKPLGSPAAATSSHAAPMERVASSSSTRQAANLPPLPGSSIWSSDFAMYANQYNGSQARLSPLGGGFRNGGSGGHSRGESVNSVRSGEWAYSSLSPSHPPQHNGIGNGAAWGNSAAPHAPGYGAPSRYVPAHPQNVGMVSPLLFGPSAWDSAPNSSYYRTPPNGQGG